MNVNELWDFIKWPLQVFILPLVLYFHRLITGRLSRLEEKTLELEKENVRIQANYVTKQELTKIVAEVRQLLQESNHTLETRLEKMIDLKNDSIRTSLEILVNKNK